MSNHYTGQAIPRSDAPEKVTGQATYTAEHSVANKLHGIVISSSCSKGRITKIDAGPALALDGVEAVLTHEHDYKTARFDLSYKDMDSPPGSPFRPLASSEIRFAMQPVAVVLAQTIELARYAARLVEIDYEVESHNTSFLTSFDEAQKGDGIRAGFQSPSSRGNFAEAFEEAPIQFSADYLHPAHHHNPMEMHASVVEYGEDGTLTIYDKTQGVLNTQHYVAMAFGIKRKKVRVLSPYVGGAFGSGLRPQYQLYLATLAALELERSVSIELTRAQMFSFGHRPMTHQTVSLGADREGRISAIHHHAIAETSTFENYIESVVNWAGKLYASEHVEEKYDIVPLDTYTPLDMRAPGGASGLWALESAMDELSYELDIDPIALRLKNYAEEDPSEGNPFSSKALKECFAEGARRFGWNSRAHKPKTRREGNVWVGHGMACGIWDAMQFPTRAAATLSADLGLVVRTATADIGTGTYTIMRQIAAERLGLPYDKVSAKLGDSDFPLAFIEGGSATAASVGTAVDKVCRKIAKELLKEAGKMKDSPFHGAGLDDVVFADGRIWQKDDRSLSVGLDEIFKGRDLSAIEKKATALPNMLKQRKYSMNTHSAVFVEVHVDDDAGFVSVKKVVSAIAAGRILNLTTARSQILGGVVWGISMALHEESYMDTQLGRFINHDLANYHISSNADIEDIEVVFVEEDDTIASPIGVKGIGEIGMVGVAAAVANAVYNATGKRVRELPITPERFFS